MKDPTICSADVSALQMLTFLSETCEHFVMHHPLVSMVRKLHLLVSTCQDGKTCLPNL